MMSADSERPLACRRGYIVRPPATHAEGGMAMRDKILPILVVAAWCASLATPVRAAPPAAPAVTVGAGIKHLQFDWAAVPQSNYYELWFKANGGAAWIKYNETSAARTRFVVSVSVHLLDWRVAKYRVAACNFSGCTNSAEIGVADLARDAVGYIKPAAPGNVYGFGAGTAVSADGKTIAVASGELVDDAGRSAVVNVYRRDGLTWKLDPRVVPSLPLPDTAIPTQYQLNPVALNGDGTVLVLGVVLHSSGAAAGSPPESGAVYIFRYDGARWNQEALRESPYPLGYLGWHVDVDDAGDLVIASRYVDRDNIPETLAYRYSSTGWSAGEALPILRKGIFQMVCDQPALSGNGKTVVRVCDGGVINSRYVQMLRTTDWKQSGEIFIGSPIRARFRDGAIDTNYEGNRIVVLMEEGRVGTFWKGVTGWQQDGNFSGGSGAFNAFGHKLTMSRDGKLVAVGDLNSCHPGTGPVYGPFGSCSVTGSGKVTIYQYSANTWRVRSYLKPNNTAIQAFGQAVSLGDNGKILVVGAPFETSNATGIDGDQTNTSAPERGAVWLY